LACGARELVGVGERDLWHPQRSEDGHLGESGGAAEATARERGARDDQAVGRVDGGLRVALVILEDDLERHRLSADLEAARIVDDSRGYLRASLRLGTFLGGS